MPFDSKVNSVKLSGLSRDQQAFLEKAMAVEHKPGEEKLAIYVDGSNGEYLFVEDAPMPIKANKMMVDAPPGLYRTGINGVLRTVHGVLAVPDERPKWWKPLPAGFAKHEEGDDLLQGAFREYREEVVIFSLDRKLQFVPRGVPPGFTVPSLGIDKIEAATEVGVIVPKAFHVNKVEKVIELIFEHDLTSLPEKHSVAYDDDWFQGGHFGAPVVTLNNGRFTGFYSGQQGYVAAVDYKFHPTYTDPPHGYNTLFL